MLADLLLLVAAWDALVSVACLHLGTGCHGCCTLLLLPSGVLCKVDDICFLEIIRGCSFDCVALLVVYGQWSNIDCAWIDTLQR